MSFRGRSEPWFKQSKSKIEERLQNLLRIQITVDGKIWIVNSKLFRQNPSFVRRQIKSKMKLNRMLSRITYEESYE